MKADIRNLVQSTIRAMRVPSRYFLLLGYTANNIATLVNSLQNGVNSISL